MRTKERLEVGYRLNGRYRVCRSLGQGGFGITYLAEDELLGQKIVIKEYFPAGLCQAGGGWKYPDHGGDGPGCFYGGQEPLPAGGAYSYFSFGCAGCRKGVELFSGKSDRLSGHGVCAGDFSSKLAGAKQRGAIL